MLGEIYFPKNVAITDKQGFIFNDKFCQRMREYMEKVKKDVGNKIKAKML